jgi:hypothetical protein
MAPGLPQGSPKPNCHLKGVIIDVNGEFDGESCKRHQLTVVFLKETVLKPEFIEKVRDPTKTKTEEPDRIYDWDNDKMWLSNTI